jgi:hypothetical protein
MVMSLPVPQIVDADMIDQVVAERQGGPNAGYFTGMHAEWLGRIANYRAAGGNPEIISVWPGIDAHKTKFLTLYNSPQDDSVQKPILSSLRSRLLQLCPSCGEDGQPNTLDHYLPKDVYPELSIVPINLFPMCDICQGEKLKRTLDADNKRLFLQPYFDRFLDAQAVLLSIGRPFSAPRWIYLEPHPSLSNDEALLVGRHLKALNYGKRYMRFFRDQHARMLKLANRARAARQDVSQNLVIFRDNAKDKSINSWVHIFYDGVLQNPSLVRYLAEGRLPAFR